MEEREQLTSHLPGEVVEVYRQPVPGEVVERYSRPLPGQSAPPERPRKKSRRGLWIFLIGLAVVLGIAAGVLVWSWLSPGRILDRFEYWYDYGWEEDAEASGEITIPTYPTGEGATLEVETDRGPELTAQEIYRRVNPSVVTVLAQLEGSASVGTGVIFRTAISSPTTTCWRAAGTAPWPWTPAGPMRPCMWRGMSGTTWRC